MKRLLLLLLLFVFSCKKVNTLKNNISNNNDQNNEKEIVQLFKKTLESNHFTKFLHLDIKGRDSLYLIKNQDIRNDFEILNNAIKVILVNENNVKNKNYIKIYKLTKSDTVVNINYYYAIENVNMNFLLNKKNEEWEITKVDAFEL